MLHLRKPFIKARTAHYSSLIEENKNNPRFLFSTVARLTKSPSSVEPCFLLTLSSNDFMSFFTSKIVSIREKINGILPTMVTNASQTAQTAGLLVVPRVSKRRLGGKAVSYQAPLLWNQLPVDVQEAETLSNFKIRLKTFLF